MIRFGFINMKTLPVRDCIAEILSSQNRGERERVTSEISWVNRTDRSFAQGLNRTLKEAEAVPQGLKPTIKTMAYRSGKPLRQNPEFFSAL